MTSKRVLVAPLDWGLGHATRCIPIINQLLELKCEVIIGGSGSSLALLKVEYPLLSFIELPPYNPVYSSQHSMTFKMIRQLPKFFRTIREEHSAVENLIGKKKIDIVISDNRYGCWSNKAKCIFITHQLNILMPSGLKWLSRILNGINHKYISKFNACWVPDYLGKNNLSGKLSYNYNLKVNYIGTLSRFDVCLPKPAFKYELLVILSGPEPQRTILEEILIKQISRSKLKTCVVRGLPESERRQIKDKMEVVDFLNTTQLNQALCESEIIIARSGYSTIMDLARLEKRAIFIPTPGQTEQMYLAKELHDKGIAYSMSQHNFDLQKSLQEIGNFKGFGATLENGNLLKHTISELVK